MISATALQLNSAVTVIAGEDAAIERESKEYYRWFFESEPEWEKFRNK
jgi:hypothetical protein